jgi:CBS domain-containing protein
MTDPSPMTEFFFKRVRDYIGGAPALVPPDAPLRDVAGAMTTGKKSVVIVIDDNQRPLGLVTEQDIVRRVVFSADPGQPVSDVMSAPVEAVGEDDYLYQALTSMRRRGRRHLVVIDIEGRVTGVLDRFRVTELASGDLISRIDDITRDRDLDGLTETKAAQVSLTRDLMGGGVPAPEVLALLTHINNDIYSLVAALNAKALEKEGQGPAPLDYCLVIMGSGGRGENYLTPDQDYGFILEDAADEEITAADPWFLELATRTSRDLDRIGLTYCQGDVMATNPLWRKPLRGWIAQVDHWNRSPTEQALLNFDIFFDFRGISGEIGLANDLRIHVTEIMRGNKPFVRRLYSADRDLGTALRWFGRFATVKEGPHTGKIDLKLHGLFPLVQGIRLLALREGVAEVGTLARMAGLREQGVLTEDEHDELTGAFTFLAGFILRTQIRDFEATGAASNCVDPASLTRREKVDLRQALTAVDGLRSKINFEVGGELY